ncbi:hypothetical protein M408DRAFT_110290 [Serendipita vermifera MAFF 305830]|uniref:Uncharacterized protein n=2 Tax=Serendipita vermifera MAFF 305830 TaxID=933852 RepID=A0A0C3APS6_SERVB|nr:hypothetical protein M408DRAFT_110290 [Serendipita vermifera MAFF 305830]
MEALTPPSSIWRSRSPKPSSRPATPSKRAPIPAYNGANDPNASSVFINQFPSDAQTQQRDDLPLWCYTDPAPSQFGRLPTSLSSPNLNSMKVEAVSPPSSIWRPRTPNPSSKVATRSQHTSKPKLTPAYSDFINRFPEYAETKQLDDLREREFRRLRQSRGVYMDYMGACLYPDFLVKEHSKLLTQQVVGNTHSDSPS